MTAARTASAARRALSPTSVARARPSAEIGARGTRSSSFGSANTKVWLRPRDFAEYIAQLADDLYHSYKVSGDEIVLEVDVDVPPLPIDIAIPCGLLLNELMSNCLKHAFRDASEGHIRVSLQREGVDAIALTVADDGAGFPPDIDFRDTTSFGMQLVNTLVEQLAGVVELKNDRGTVFTVTFPHDR